jgi:hypothetical protein
MALTDVMNTSRCTYVWVGIEASTFALKKSSVGSSNVCAIKLYCKVNGTHVQWNSDYTALLKGHMYKRDRKWKSYPEILQISWLKFQ